MTTDHGDAKTTDGEGMGKDRRGVWKWFVILY